MTTEQSNKERHQPPKVTIGVPVYNGEAYLAEALDSILGQTFGDFEVIISDNASCDRTEDICRDYASRDPRITYIRQEKNAGAAPNFNLLVSLAKGKYFKWAASDDLIAPEFLASCLEALESNSNASIAMTQTRIVDEAGRELDCQSVSSAFTSPEFNERFAALLPMRACFEVFGLIRIEMLRKTKLIVGSSHGDGVLLCALGAQGPFEAISKPLFSARRHPEQSVALGKDRRAYSEWFDSRNKGKLILPTMRMLKEFALIPFAYSLGFNERLSAVASLLSFAWSKRRGLLGDTKYLLRWALLSVLLPAKP